MHVIYIASVFDDECLNKRFDGKPVIPYAANKYNTLLFEGIVKNHIDTEVLSVVPISRSFYKKNFFKGYTVRKSGLKICYLSQVNLPVVKNIFNILGGFFKTLFAPCDSVIVYDVLVVSASIGASSAAKLRGFKKLGIVTDLPKFQPISQSSFMRKMNEKLIGASDGYVFLTEQMNDEINRNLKPYLVLEGHVDSKMEAAKHKPFAEKRCVIYAGSLMKIYGIDTLCMAFIKYAKPNEELHIYGIGDYEDELRVLCQVNDNIFYHGNRQNIEIVQAELDASLLVNPRPAKGEYTKYSFPSKTLEYMVSGTPVLSSRLAGIPPEYGNYIFYFEENTVDCLGRKIRELLDLSPQMLREKGEKARVFALKEKNNIVQTKKIIDLCNELRKK